MRRPRFLPSRLPKDYVDPSAASHPAGESLLQQIDADLDTIEVTLLQLESESQQYSHRLSLIRDVLHMFDTSEHPNAANALREREQTVARSMLEAARDIDAALSENEHRRASLLETARKLHQARDQLSPSRTNPVGIMDDAGVLGDRAEVRPETQHHAGSTSAPATPPEELERMLSGHPLAATQRFRQPDAISRSATIPVAVVSVPDPVRPSGDTTTAPHGINSRRSPDRWRRLLVVVGGALLLIPVASGTMLAASMLGDEDSGFVPTTTTAPAGVATVGQDLTGTASVGGSATSTTVAGSLNPSPTRNELPVPALSPTPPSPAQTPSTTPAVPVTPATPVDVGTMVARVIDAESALQTGQIDASVNYTDGTRSSTSIVFDFGTPGGTAKVSISTTYQSGQQTRVTEQIMIGAQAWQRVADGNWQAVSNVEGVWGQVQAFLPRMASAPAPERESDERLGELHWYDAGRNADITLQVNPETGVPELMLQVSRTTGSVLTVTYTGWNTPTRIDPPVT